MKKLFKLNVSPSKIEKTKTKFKKQRCMSCNKCKDITKCLSCSRTCDPNKPLLNETVHLPNDNFTLEEDFITDKIDLFQATYNYNKCSKCKNNKECMSCIESKNKTFLFILLFVILAIFLFFNKKNLKDEISLIRPGTVKQGELSTLSYDETKAKLQEKVDASRFEINMNSNLYLNEDLSTYNLLLSNTERNRYACNVDIYLDTNNEIIYQSPTLKPGEYIDHIKLKTDLPSGDHAATALYTIIDMESGRQTGSISVGIKIHK